MHHPPLMGWGFSSVLDLLLAKTDTGCSTSSEREDLRINPVITSEKEKCFEFLLRRH